MRRFLAYIVMMLTMVCALIFNTQAVLDQKTDAMEYGSGTEMVYSLTKREKESYDLDKYTNLDQTGTENLENIDIEKEVMDRLDLAGVRNANVRIVEGNPETQEGYQLRISLSPLNENELNRVKQVIGITGSLSIGTIGDDTVMYADGGKLFDYSSDLATIVYNGTTPYPTIKLLQEDYDTLVENAKEAAEAHKNDKKSKNHILYAENDEEESEDNSSTVYLWTNKTIDDTYDKAFGTNDTVVQDKVKSKVLATLDLTNWDSETKRLSITADANGNAFDISSARAFVNMLNATDYGFDIEFLYQNSVPATFGHNESGTTITYIVAGVILLAVIALLIVFFGLAGVSASLTMLASGLFSFFLFSILGFEFSVAALVGLIILVAQSLLISLNYFERVKSERKKGRDLEKANREGYHKSFLPSLDASAVVFLASLFSFLLAVGSYKTLFGVVMIGSIFTFIITNYINKWMMYWLCKNDHDEGKTFIFGRISKKEFKTKSFAHKDKHFTGKLTFILPIVAAVLLGAGLPTTYALSKDKSFFNSSSDFASSYTLNIQFSGDSQRYETLTTKETYIDYLTEIGKDATNVSNNEAYVMYSNEEAKPEGDTVSFSYDPDSAFVNIVEKKDEEGNVYYIHYFTLTVSADLDELVAADGKNIMGIIYDTMNGRGIELDESTEVAPVIGYSHYMADTLKAGSYVSKPTNIAHNYLSMFLLVFLISVFAAIYILCRYGLNIALTSLVSGTVLSALSIGILAITRIPFTSFTGFAVLASVLIFNMLLVIVLGGNKETLKERGIKKTATEEEREEIANTIANRSLSVVIPTMILSTLFSIGFVFIDISLLGLAISSLVFSLLSFFLLYFYAVPLYYFFATHVFFRALKAKIEAHREKRGKKKAEKVINKDGIVYVDSEGPHETIVPGLNDFRESK